RGGPRGSGLRPAGPAGRRARGPAWYHNIAANPDQVWIEFGGRQLRVIPYPARRRRTRMHGSRSRSPSRRLRGTSRNPTAPSPSSGSPAPAEPRERAGKLSGPLPASFLSFLLIVGEPVRQRPFPQLGLQPGPLLRAQLLP